MTTDDPYNLDRFMRAQEADYDRALSELRNGRKRSHWMWYVFPQLAGLGTSSNSIHYAIGGLDEAKAYLAHPILGARLLECAGAVLRHEGLTASAIFGSPDDMKLRSCATLFAAASPPDSAFQQIIDTFFHGQPDDRTLRLLQHQQLT